MDDIYQSINFHHCPVDDSHIPLLTNDVHVLRKNNASGNDGDDDDGDDDANKKKDDVDIRSNTVFLVSSVVLSVSISESTHRT